MEAVRRAPAPVHAGLQSVRRRAGLRGRLEVLGHAPLVVADVAHNPDGIAAALAFVAAQREAGVLYVLLGLMSDKDGATIGRLLAGAGALVYAVGLGSERAVPPEALASTLRAARAAVQGAGTFDEGWQRLRTKATRSDVVLVTGSHQAVERLLRRPESDAQTAPKT